MPRSPQQTAEAKLHAAKRNLDAALKAVDTLEQRYRQAMVAAADAGIPKVEIARLIGTSDTRVHQIIRAQRERSEA